MRLNALLAVSLLALSCAPPVRGPLARLGLETLPVRTIERAGRPKDRLEASLRLEVFPSLRKDDPVRLCVDLAVQPDLRALGVALDAAGLDRAERAALTWEALAEAEVSRAPFRGWLAEQEGVSGLVSFRSFSRICFDGSERIALAAVEREDVARVLLVAPPPDSMAPSPAPPRETALARDHWALAALGVDRVHEAGHRGQGVIVAILDSGVDETHAALAGRSVGRFSVRPPRGRDLAHGRQVLAAAVGASGLGVAPEASWAAADPLPEDSRDPEVFARCIDWLLGEVRPQVVVAPWDLPPGTAWTTDFVLAFGALRTAGAAVVFPAGNTGPAPGANRSPANLPALAPDGAPAFSVAGLDRDGSAYRLSNRGPSAVDGSPFPQVAVPAVRLAVLDPEGKRSAVIGEGTSFASGYAAGVVALLMSARPELTGPQAEALLRDTARDLGTPGHDPVFGHGRLDLLTALGLE